jgi:hypothetical protein
MFDAQTSVSSSATAARASEPIIDQTGGIDHQVVQVPASSWGNWPSRIDRLAASRREATGFGW